MTGQKASARDWTFQHYAPAWQYSPARFIFDAHYKLYGDGRFVSMDPTAGTEVELSGAQLKGELGHRKKRLSELPASIDDGPLDETIAPMCAGRKSADPSKPATVAGCDLPRSSD